MTAPSVWRVATGDGPRWATEAGDEFILHALPPWAPGWDPDLRLGRVARDRAELLAPVTPSKIVCVARNYRAHAAELGNEVPVDPLFFLKPPSSLLDPGGAIVRPEGIGRVEYEGELGAVIGRRMHHVPEEFALSHVYGYTALVDVTARALQKSLGHFSQAKGYDTFCPVGPCVVAGLDPRSVGVVTRKNGVRVQDGNTRDMVHPVAKLLAYVSRVMTLEPGDLVATGTPEGVGPIEGGDTLEVEIEGVGVLAVRVR